MRRILLPLFAITLVATPIWLEAQNPQNPTLTFTGAPEGTSIWLEVSNDNGKTWKPNPLGSTSPSGGLALTPAQTGLLSGKPMITVRYDTCQAGNSIHLFPEGPGSQAAEDNCPPGCSCERHKKVGAWGSNLTDQAVFPPPSSIKVKQSSKERFIDKPAGKAVVIGVPVAVITGVALTQGGSDTGGTPGGTTKSFPDVVPYTFTGSYTASATTCGAANSTGSVALSGSMASTAAILTMGSTTHSVTGSTTQSPTDQTFKFTGIGTATSPTAGTFTINVTFQFDTGTGVTGPVTFVFSTCNAAYTFQGNR